MNEKKIEHLAYKLKRNHDEKKGGAIVFLGAGCSVSAGIPKASDIVDYVLDKYKDNPDIKCINGKPEYEHLMNCLDSNDRKEVFKYFVDKAKINVSHIYLAHLMSLGFVEYIVTVNFDDLAQKALALYNIFPPIYDISILKDFTTKPLEPQSITQLHGHYNGIWQLNTQDEMDKVIENGIVKSIFEKIIVNRPFIVVGYSGTDKILDVLAGLGRFDGGLYWVGYKEYEPQKKVRENLLDKKNNESFYISGYDADSFFLKLNAELKNETPKFFSQPFSHLLEVLESVVDIEDSEDYKTVKDRFAISVKNAKDAINRYETVNKEPQLTVEEISENQLKTKLIDRLINKKYDDVEQLEKQVKAKGYKNLLPNVADLYNSSAVFNGDKGLDEAGIEAAKLLLKAIDDCRKTIELQPDHKYAHYNLGTYTGGLAKTKTGLEAEELYKQAFEKYAKAIEIKPDFDKAYYNWGTYLGKLAETKTGVEAEELYKQATDKFAKAIEIKPDDHEAYNNWGTYLGKLAETKTGVEAEELYKQAFEKYAKVIEIKPDYHEAYYNWGICLGNLAKTKTGVEAEELYKQSFEKYAKAIEIKPDYHKAYYNWAGGLMFFARTKSNEEANEILKEASEKATKAFELGGSAYNIACINALTDNFDEAFRLLEICLEKKDITFEHVEKDEDWDKLREMPKYKELKKRFLKL